MDVIQIETTSLHHPAYAGITPFQGDVDEVFYVNFLGSLFRKEFCLGEGSALANLYTEADIRHFFKMQKEEYQLSRRWINTTFPNADEEYFQYINLLESIKESSSTGFCMLELGAGYGRWGINAAKALEKLRPEVPYQFICVEASPKHVSWLQTALRDNNVHLEQCTIIQAAIGPKRGFAWFPVESRYVSRAYYESDIKDSSSLMYTMASPMRSVRLITLNDILEAQHIVDLIDMDIQGAEADVIESSIGILSDKVKRLYIGTNSRLGEDRIYNILEQFGWQNIFHFPCHSKQQTDYGVILFTDGVQSWINPRLCINK